jgi:branched-chain amino acid transport system ATP-binding protein
VNLLDGFRVSKNFGGLRALDEVDFAVEKGEIVGLIGANGAGKTTLFNLISGVYNPSSGHIRFKGEDITGMKPYKVCRRGIGRTFQVVKPFLNMTVLKNVSTGRLFGKDRLQDRKEAEHQAREILEFVGLSEKAHIPTRELTLADRKRIEIARSLATNPDLLLLDEVLAGLTPTETTEAMTLIQGILQDFGVTILMVEHVMKAVVGVCSRILVLHYGQKIAEGSPREIAENPSVIKAYLGEKFEI